VGGFTLSHLHILFLLAGLFLASSTGMVNGQNVADKMGASPTRAQITTQREGFLMTHRWDEGTELWVMKPGFGPPLGVKPRSEVVAARDEFLRNNRWDELSRGWTPLQSGPRDMSAMSSAQVRAETLQFVRTHRWDETTEAWVTK